MLLLPEALFDLFQKLLQREWLLQKAKVIGVFKVAFKGILRIARHEYELGLVSALADFRQHRWAIHFRHDNVREDQLKPVLVIVDGFKSHLT